METFTDPSRREPKGDHNRRLSLAWTPISSPRKPA